MGKKAVTNKALSGSKDIIPIARKGKGFGGMGDLNVNDQFSGEFGKHSRTEPIPYVPPVEQQAYKAGIMSDKFNQTAGEFGSKGLSFDSPTANPAAGTNKFNFARLGKKVGDVVPYLSNLANSMRTPPMPAVPKLAEHVVTATPSYEASLGEVRRQVRGANLGADRGLDEQSAAAVKAGNLTQGIRAANLVQEQQANETAQALNRGAVVNAGIDASNNAIWNNYQNERVGRTIAMQRTASENLSNATDKYIAQQTERAQADLDIEKANILKEAFKDSGVFARMMADMKKKGVVTEDSSVAGVNHLGGFLRKVFAEGGPLRVNEQVPQAKTREATRSGDAMIISPMDQKLLDDQELLQRQQALWATQNPGANLAQLQQTLQQTQGFMKDGDWYPNANYRTPGRVVAPATNHAAAAAATYASKFAMGGLIKRAAWKRKTC